MNGLMFTCHYWMKQKDEEYWEEINRTIIGRLKIRPRPKLIPLFLWHWFLSHIVFIRVRFEIPERVVKDAITIKQVEVRTK